MRINIYNEELTDEIKVFRRKDDKGDIFTGVRLYLQSPESLHNTEYDDDRNAITFYVLANPERKMLVDIFRRMADALESRPT